MFRNGLRLLEGNFGLHVKSFRGGGRVGSERNNYVKALKGGKRGKNEEMKQEERKKEEGEDEPSLMANYCFSKSNAIRPRFFNKHKSGCVGGEQFTGAILR